MILDSKALIGDLEAVFPVSFFQFKLYPDGAYELPYVSKGSFELYGLTAEQLMADPQVVLNILQSEDQAGFMQSIYDSAETLTPWFFEKWITIPTGNKKFLKAKSKPQRQPDGSTIWNGIFYDETERVLSQDQLDKNAILAKATNKLAKVGGWYCEVNKGFEDLFWSDEAYAIHDLEPGTPLTFELVSSFTVAEITEYSHKYWFNLFLTGEPFDIEVPITTAKGNLKWIRQIAEVEFKNGVPFRAYGAFQDISDRINHLQELSFSEERFKNVFDYAPIGMALLSNSGKWLRVNRSLCKILDYQEAELLNLTFQEITYPEDLQKDLELLQRIKNREIDSYQHEKRYISKSGKLIWTLLSVSCIRNLKGDSLYFIAQVCDISEQKEVQQMLFKAKEQAEQGTLAKSQFLSTMSHEIRTPMNAVIGITNLLLQNNPKPDQMESLKVLKFSAENLLVLINDILDFTKIEEGKIEFEEVDFSLRDLISNIRAAQLQKADEKGLRLKLMLDEDLPETLVGDPVRIGQVLTNLINNAVKFTEAGGVTVEVVLKQHDDAWATISFNIKDTGIGISDDKIPYIFDLFTQASPDITRKFGGTGLGLAISKKLLQLQGSAIDVKSKLGAGTTFSFELKLKISDKKLEINSSRNSSKEKKTLKGVRLLLVEDNQFNVFIAQQFLNNWDVNFDVAGNGKDALGMLQQNEYDVVLMDLQMPEMDGYEATEVISNQETTYANIPVIALTASAMLDIKDRAFAVGMDDYLSKPFNPEELFRKIKKYAAKPAL
ncbi:PAS domain S-box protein [Adhaeribacter aquaticus]|uniref:PAS domain S-box protein n=1 Tax=Adhaeribacter aquaticus TaxID=299567 RepID=UPI00042165B5|nr:PAS domain S-box protein [Adhaeribacter aquaticus]